MRARLPAGTAGSTDVRLVVKPNFTWVGNTTIDASGWTTISGTYTLPAEVDPAASQVYVGSTDQAAPYTILVDDILITAPAAPPPTVTVLSTDFESGLDGWVPRGDAQGDPTVTPDDRRIAQPDARRPRLRPDLAGRRHRPRRDRDHEPGHDLRDHRRGCKFAAGNPTDTLWLSMRRTNDGSDSFDTLGQFTAVSGTTFVEVSATYAMGEADSAFLYFESRYPDGTTAPFLVDDITVASQAPPVVEDLHARQGHGRLPARRRDRLARDDRRVVGAPAAALRPGHAREPHEARGLVRRRARPSGSTPRPRRSWTSPQDNGIARLRPHARLAQPDAGLVLPARRRARRSRRATPTRRSCGPAARPHLQRRRDAERHVRAVRQRHQPARRLRRGQRGGLRRHDRGRRPAPQPLVRRPRRELHRPRVPVRERGVQRRLRGGRAPPIRSTLSINDYNTEQAGKRRRLHALVERLLDRGVPGRRRRPPVPPQPGDAGRRRSRTRSPRSRTCR